MEAQCNFTLEHIGINPGGEDAVRIAELFAAVLGVPVKEGKSGITGCFASFEELGRISKKIDSLIAEMGNNLHKGLINQNQINGDGHKHTCEYCDYTDVCMNRREIELSQAQDYSFDEVLSKLKEDEDAKVD